MFESFQLFLFRGWFELFYEYFNPMHVFWNAAKFALLGFVIALVLMIICVKFKIFRRQNKYWNVFTKLYFIYIPIVFIVAGIGFGTLQYVKTVSDKAVNTLLQPAKQAMLGYLQGLPPETCAILSPAELKNKIRSEIELVFNDTATESRIQNVVNNLPAPAKEWVFETLVDFTIDKLNTKVSDATGLDKEMVSKLWHQNIAESLKGDLLNDIFNQRVHKLINSYQRSLLYFLLLLLLVPTADAIIAKVLKKRRSSV